MQPTGPNAGPKPAFFATTMRLCAGTKILTEIYQASPARAVWHFFLLTLLCSIMASVVGTLVQRGRFERTGQALDEEIGAFVSTPETISFEKNPDVPRRLRLPYITLEYYPGNTFNSDDFNIDRTSNIGIVILPGGLASWSQVNWKGEDIFSANLLPASTLYAWLSEETGKNGQDEALLNAAMSPRWEMFSGPGLAETLKEEFGEEAIRKKASAKTAAEKEERPIATTGSQAARFALSMLTAVILLMTFGRNFLETGLIILLVSLVQYLRASTLPKEIIFRNVLTIMIYSTFPAQIFATLFDAAGGGRYISFQLLFVGIFFVYQIFAFRAVLRKVCPQIERKDDSDDSDF